MLANSSVAAQLAASQEGLNSMEQFKHVSSYVANIAICY
jgi:hypothetical protein